MHTKNHLNTLFQRDRKLEPELWHINEMTCHAQQDGMPRALNQQTSRDDDFKLETIRAQKLDPLHPFKDNSSLFTPQHLDKTHRTDA